MNNEGANCDNIQCTMIVIIPTSLHTFGGEGEKGRYRDKEGRKVKGRKYIKKAVKGKGRERREERVIGREEWMEEREGRYVWE